MFDSNAISALVHHRAGWEQFARRIDRLTTDQRLISTITLSELQTMIAKAEAPEAKRILVWRVLLNFAIERDANDGPSLAMRFSSPPSWFQLAPYHSLTRNCPTKPAVPLLPTT
jgi:hypothetical protein